MQSYDAKRNEEGRWQVLRYLFNRNPNALDAASITDGLNRTGFPASRGEVEEWLKFWVEFQPQPALKAAQPAWGSTTFYAITPAGILTVERSGTL